MDTTLEPEVLAEKLVGIGYSREGIADMPGQFAVRGGIVDVFPVQDEVPVRIEFWGDTIDSIRSYDAASQRSIANTDSCTIFPAQEITISKEEQEKGLKLIEKDAKKQEKSLSTAEDESAVTNLKRTLRELKENLEYFGGKVGLDSYVNYFLDDTVSFFEYFDPERTTTFIDEPKMVSETLDALEYEFDESMKGRLVRGYIFPKQTEAVFKANRIFSVLKNMKVLMLSTMDYRFSGLPAASTFELSVAATASYNGNFDMLISDLLKWRKRKYRVILVAASRSRGVRLAEDLRDNGLSAFYSADLDRVPQEGEVVVLSGHLSRGFEYPLIRFAFVCETDIFGVQKTVKKKKKYGNAGPRIESFAELNESS